MIVEHPDIAAEQVITAVGRAWGLDVTGGRRVGLGAQSWHWQVSGEHCGRWFATLEPVRRADERHQRVAAYEAAAQLGRSLDVVVAPVRTRDARMAVDLSPGLLLTVSPFLDGEPAGRAVDDDARAVVAQVMGALHRQPRPRGVPVWRPRVGRRDGRAELERCLELSVWTGGPHAPAAGRLVGESASLLRASLRRFALLAAAVAGSVDRWVVTHGEPQSAHVLLTAQGPRLVAWGQVALAPRERDLGAALGEADGNEPWFAYVEAGGRPEALSPDTLELFALEGHLSVIAEQATRFSRPHGDTDDDRRCLGRLEDEVTALTRRWG